MTTSSRAVPPITHPTDDEFPGYHPLSSMAVVGFLCGLTSILTFVSLKFAFIPLLGLAFSSLALRRIAVLENAMTGRRFALTGLTLSLLFGLAAPTRQAVARLQMRNESRRLAQQWFDMLKERQPYMAHQLEIAAALRSTPDKMAKNSSHPMPRMQFERFLGRSVVQILLTLGERAQVRYFQQLSLSDVAGLHGVIDVYAVTVDERGAKTTFFVDLQLERTKNYVDGSWEWLIRSAEFRTKPPPALPALH
jgi:hypothetical protein